MNSFIATADSTPATPETGTIVNDGWFPDVDITNMRDAMRLDGTVTQERLKQALIAAILSVNEDLDDWKIQQQAAGHQDLENVPAKTIDGESKFVALYRRAVYSTAKADLIEKYRDFDTTHDGNKKADQLDSSADEQRRNAHWAIADIVGRRRTTVELI